MKANKYCLAGFCLSAMWLLAGCTTTDGGSRSSVQDNEEILLLREDVNRCNDRMKTMELEQRRIMDEIQQLRARSSDEGTRARLDELDRRVSALDAARASDRQAIVDQLSGNVAKMMGSGTATSKTAPKKAATSASDTGYEHIVKDGETLSTIASAYKVKPSAIIEANDLKNPDVLRKGQKLFIPQQ